jgi:uncharacterized protein YabN with tetrapyrrole methylase and pyrophosphatase domain
MNAGSLTVVGTGFGGYGQITFESASIIETAEKVLYLTDNRLTTDWIKRANPTSEPLYSFYVGRPNRIQTYLEITNHILSFVRQNLRVCAVFYGHPGVFVFPSHEAIIRTREEGFEARMLPGISAEDCLFSDLGVDHGHSGCQSFEATDFLVRPRQVDVSVPVILWQIGGIGQIDHSLDPNNANVVILSEVLQSLYGAEHEVVIYEAAPYPLYDPVIQFVPLNGLASAGVTLRSTLYVPPKGPRMIDRAMVRRLGISEDYLSHNRAEIRFKTSRPYANPKPRSLGGL